MRYKLLGKSGLRVSELCLGTMTFGQDWGSMLAGASKEEPRKIFDLFVEAGAILLILQIYIKKEPVKNMLGNS
jgi:aryl-alcohol dehydrogenase-like predicted oxidoreductase